ncbi:MAG: peptidylprolyl isomerase [Bacteroidota bacterium]|nr:peptidylprolyl isomerase [Bacteroidota bacterium]
MKHLSSSRSKHFKATLIGSALLLATAGSAQPQSLLIDRIVGVVGREAILHSDLVARAEQLRQNGQNVSDVSICGELEDLLYEKLLVEQGRIDSVQVDEGQVEAELDRRVRYFSSQLGGDEKLEEFYGKSVAEIKADFREQVREQLLVQNMQQKVTSDIRITPKDVRKFFDKIPADSIPLINAEVEYAQILKIPKPNEEEERRVRRKIEEYRESVLKGERDFCTVAVLYSEDPASAKECGELGMVPTGAMVPEFDAVAMSLKDNEVSQVFKTQYGYHFMQMIERRGEQFNARHVLMRPQVGAPDLQKAKQELDSLASLIGAGTISFAQAAVENSDDEESKGTSGLMIEPNNNSARWDMSTLDQQTFFVLDKLQKDQVSEPQLIVMPDASKAYRIVQLLLRTEPHRANLKEDYRLIQQAAEGKLRSEAIDKWVQDRIGSTYVRLADEYRTCGFVHDWGLQAAVE